MKKPGAKLKLILYYLCVTALVAGAFILLFSLISYGAGGVAGAFKIMGLIACVALIVFLAVLIVRCDVSLKRQRLEERAAEENAKQDSKETGEKTE